VLEQPLESDEIVKFSRPSGASFTRRGAGERVLAAGSSNPSVDGRSQGAPLTIAQRGHRSRRLSGG
jgi:hypothetical protein